MKSLRRVLHGTVLLSFLEAISSVACSTAAVSAPLPTSDQRDTLLNHPNWLPLDTNQALNNAPVMFSDLWRTFSSNARQAVLYERDTLFAALEINLRCVNYLLDAVTPCRITIHVRSSDPKIKYVNSDVLPLDPTKGIFSGSCTIRNSLDTVYVPRASNGILEVVASQGDFAIGGWQYRYDATESRNAIEFPIYVALEPRVLERIIGATNIGLITAAWAAKGSPDALVADSINSLWHDALAKNWRQFGLRDERSANAIVFKSYSPGELAEVIDGTCNTLSQQSLPPQGRHLLICIADSKFLHPYSQRLRLSGKNANWNPSFLRETNASPFSVILNNIARANRNCMNSNSSGANSSLIQPVFIPLPDTHFVLNSRVYNELWGDLSLRAGGPSAASEWVPSDRTTLDRARWQLRHFLLEQCLKVWVDWKPARDPYLTINVRIQLFTPPDPEGHWQLSVPEYSKADYISIPQSRADSVRDRHESMVWFLGAHSIDQPLQVGVRVPEAWVSRDDSLEFVLDYVPYKGQRADASDGVISKFTLRSKNTNFAGDFGKVVEQKIENMCSIYSAQTAGCPIIWWQSGSDVAQGIDIRRNSSRPWYLDEDQDYTQGRASWRRWELGSRIAAVAGFSKRPGGNDTTTITVVALRQAGAPRRFGHEGTVKNLSGVSVFLAVMVFLSYIAHRLYFSKRYNTKPDLLEFVQAYRDDIRSGRLQVALAKKLAVRGANRILPFLEVLLLCVVPAWVWFAQQYVLPISELQKQTTWIYTGIVATLWVLVGSLRRADAPRNAFKSLAFVVVALMTVVVYAYATSNDPWILDQFWSPDSMLPSVLNFITCLLLAFYLLF